MDQVNKIDARIEDTRKYFDERKMREIVERKKNKLEYVEKKTNRKSCKK